MRTYAYHIQTQMIQTLLTLLLINSSYSLNVFNKCDSYNHANAIDPQFDSFDLIGNLSVFNHSAHCSLILQVLPIKVAQAKGSLSSHPAAIVKIPKIRKSLWRCIGNESLRALMSMEIYQHENKSIWKSDRKYLADFVLEIQFLGVNQVSLDFSLTKTDFSDVRPHTSIFTGLNADFCFRVVHHTKFLKSDGKNIPNNEYHYENGDLNVLNNQVDKFECSFRTPKPTRSIEDVYIGLLFTAAAFLLITVIVYIIIWDYHSLHGWTIFSEVLSNFFMILTVGLSHFYVRDPSMEPPSIGCLVLATLAHFFFLSTFCWMTVINFNLWTTFRSSSARKRLAHYISYATFAIGIPLVIVSIGITLDSLVSSNEEIEAHANGTKGVLLGKILPRPDYGRKYCYISKAAQGIYIFYPIGTLIVTNVVLFGLTAFSLYKHHQATKILHTSQSVQKLSATAHGNRIRTKTSSARTANETPTQSIILFAKLFCVMGVSWIAEVFAWALSKRGENVPSYWVIFDVANLVQAIAVFLIFVCKRQVLKELQRKFTSICGTS